MADDNNDNSMGVGDMTVGAVVGAGAAAAVPYAYGAMKLGKLNETAQKEIDEKLALQGDKSLYLKADEAATKAEKQFTADRSFPEQAHFKTEAGADYVEGFKAALEVHKDNYKKADGKEHDADAFKKAHEAHGKMKEEDKYPHPSHERFKNGSANFDEADKAFEAKVTEAGKKAAEPFDKEIDSLKNRLKGIEEYTAKETKTLDKAFIALKHKPVLIGTIASGIAAALIGAKIANSTGKGDPMQTADAGRGV